MTDFLIGMVMIIIGSWILRNNYLRPTDAESFSIAFDGYLGGIAAIIMGILLVFDLVDFTNG